MTLIGKRIKELRKKFGLTQVELGKKLNVTKVSVCCYELGTRTPSLDTLIDLSNVFNVNLDYLIGNDIYVISDQTEEYGFKISKEELEFIKTVRKYDKLYDKLIDDPKRFAELLNKKLN